MKHIWKVRYLKKKKKGKKMQTSATAKITSNISFGLVIGFSLLPFYEYMNIEFIVVCRQRWCRVSSVQQLIWLYSFFIFCFVVWGQIHTKSQRNKTKRTRTHIPRTNKSSQRHMHARNPIYIKTKKVNLMRRKRKCVFILARYLAEFDERSFYCRPAPTLITFC